MFKRQSLQAAGSARLVYSPVVRLGGVRSRREMQSGSAQRAQEAGPNSNAKDNRPSPGQTPTPRTGPNTGRTRQQRAQQVSEEVRMLKRGSPSAKTNGNNSPYPAVRSRGVDAEAVVGTSPGGQMGNNASAEREGPNAQGAGRVIRAGKGAPENRSERSPNGLLEEPEQPLEEPDQDEEGLEAPSTQHELVLLEQFDKQDITPVSFEPEAVTREEYLKLGQGGATIAAGNYEGVIEDRLQLLAEHTQDGFRWAPDIAHRMVKGGFVSFKSEEEKAAVLAAATLVNDPAKTGTRTFSPLAKSNQDSIVNKLVRGTYTDPKATPHKQAVLNDIVRNTLRNPTYLASDQSKLLNKIRSLLPAEKAAGGAARKPAPKPAKK